MSSSRDEMSFLDHLEELRRRVVKSLIVIVACAIPCGIFWRRIFDVMMIYPLKMSDPKPTLIFTAPAEAVMLSIKIALAGGFICAVPVVFYQVWAFIGPGLYKSEKRIVVPAVIGSTVCFLLGVAFSYLVLPFMVRFLSAYGEGVLEPYFRANDYMTFVLKLVLAFGIVFELPVLSYILTKMGVLTPGFLIRNFRYAVVLIFIFGAILTPPDVVSQTFLAVPLFILYGLSIGVSYLARGKK